MYDPDSLQPRVDHFLRDNPATSWAIHLALNRGLAVPLDLCSIFYKYCRAFPLYSTSLLSTKCLACPLEQIKAA
jgi:hypothetical protein